MTKKKKENREAIKKKFTDISDLASEWRRVNWDKIQRMRFMNADAEISPDDKYTKKIKVDE
tara:strand:- start:302 stop:484 length:183 start_codon:yes stop_codon:yes gene_type:complete